MLTKQALTTISSLDDADSEASALLDAYLRLPVPESSQLFGRLAVTLVSPLLFAAAAADRPPGDVLRWVSGEPRPVGQRTIPPAAQAEAHTILADINTEEARRAADRLHIATGHDPRTNRNIHLAAAALLVPLP